VTKDDINLYLHKYTYIYIYNHNITIFFLKHLNRKQESQLPPTDRASAAKFCYSSLYFYFWRKIWR